MSIKHVFFLSFSLAVSILAYPQENVQSTVVAVEVAAEPEIESSAQTAEEQQKALLSIVNSLGNGKKRFGSRVGSLVAIMDYELDAKSSQFGSSVIYFYHHGGDGAQVKGQNERVFQIYLDRETTRELVGGDYTVRIPLRMRTISAEESSNGVAFKRAEFLRVKVGRISGEHYLIMGSTEDSSGSFFVEYSEIDIFDVVYPTAAAAVDLIDSFEELDARFGDD